ncbi:hypothetical protein [Sphaerimonospora thailandensis]|uniref:Helix-turn-helix protein n=1 Tax=Sphaerimonospora thailandensis TaxID=795644 RepID=A0A8J3R6Y0_9ACTN|nr:hypothetical protein [Sphaerimonospora thailandensis]GIH69490.1 hypothetical protein Mth01_17430 [Sphaerimonospora thailandensis]
MPPQTETPRPDESMLPLSAAVWDHLREQAGDSLRSLARRCVDPATGMDLKRPWLADLAAGDIGRAPELWRLRALAAGLGLPLGRVQLLAARQWLGIDLEALDVRVGEGDHVIVPVPASLSEAGRARVVKWARRWAEDQADES